MSQHKIKDTKKAKEEKKLDEALKESFPGSDPVSLTQPAPAEPRPARDKPELAGSRRKAGEKSR